MIPRHQLAKTIAERTMQVQDDKQLAKEVAAYLLSENRTAELESVMRDIRQYRAENGIVEATAVSAHELNDKVMSDIKSLLRSAHPNAKKVIVKTELDRSVIGGVRVDMANQQLDLTVRSKLNTFKRLTSAVKD